MLGTTQNAAAGDETDSGRGIPQLNTRKGGVPVAIKLIIGMAVVFALLGGIAYAALVHFKSERQAAAANKEEKTETRTRLPELGGEEVAAIETDASATPLPDDNASAATAQTVQGEPATTASDTHEVPALSPEQQAQADLLERRQRAPLLAYDAGASMQAQASPSAYSDDGLAPPPLPPAASANGLREALQATPLAGNSASRLHDPNMTLTQASVIPCVLNTAIESTVPGMVSCTLSNDVYSTNGRVLLLERGSRIVGEYNSAAFKQGMSRIFVLWTRAETPAGVVIALDSPATDALGRSGVSGKVNSHFWKRFGAAMLLSVVDDAVAYAAKRGQSGDGVQLVETGQTGNDAAAIAVENSIGIPPTLSVSPGGQVNVFVARDLYFGNVYSIKRTAAR